MDVDQLNEKVIELFQSQVKDNKDIQEHRRSAQEFAFLLFEIQQIPKTSESAQSIFRKVFSGNPLGKLKIDCILEIHKDPISMQAMQTKYDKLARRWNSQLNPLSPPEDLSDDRLFNQLKFLNQFLGLQWSPEQKEGKEPLPLYNDFLVNPVIKRDLQTPADCKTMREVVGFVQQKNSPLNDLEEVPPPSAKLIRGIGNRIARLYYKESSHLTYSKAPLAFQTMFAIDQLDQYRLRGSHSRPKKLNPIFKNCQNEFAKDRKLVHRLEQKYRKECISANYTLLRRRREISPEDSPTDYSRAYFMGKVLGLPITEDMAQGKDLFPESYQAMTKKNDVADLEQRFTWASLMLNNEMLLAKHRESLERIENKLDESGYSYLFLSKSEKKELKKDRAALLKTLGGQPPPLPEKFFKSLWKEQLKRMEVLGLTPTEKQIQALEPLPVIGTQENHSLYKMESSLSLLSLIDHYNLNAKLINETWQRIKLEQKVSKWERLAQDTAGKYKGRSSSPDPFRKYVNKKRQYEDHMKAEYAGLLDVPWMQEKIADIMQIVDSFPFMDPLTEDQIMGKEPLPIIEMKNVPRGKTEYLIEDFKNYSQEEAYRIIKKWPDHWKQNFPQELKELIQTLPNKNIEGEKQDFHFF